MCLECKTSYKHSLNTIEIKPGLPDIITAQTHCLQFKRQKL